MPTPEAAATAEPHGWNERVAAEIKSIMDELKGVRDKPKRWYEGSFVVDDIVIQYERNRRLSEEYPRLELSIAAANWVSIVKYEPEKEYSVPEKHTLLVREGATKPIVFSSGNVECAHAHFLRDLKVPTGWSVECPDLSIAKELYNEGIFAYKEPLFDALCNFQNLCEDRACWLVGNLPPLFCAHSKELARTTIPFTQYGAQLELMIEAEFHFDHSNPSECSVTFAIEVDINKAICAIKTKTVQELMRDKHLHYSELSRGQLDRDNLQELRWLAEAKVEQLKDNVGDMKVVKRTSLAPTFIYMTLEDEKDKAPVQIRGLLKETIPLVKRVSTESEHMLLRLTDFGRPLSKEYSLMVDGCKQQVSFVQLWLEVWFNGVETLY